MFRLLKALLHDSVSWFLVILLFLTVILGLTTLFNRYDRLDHNKKLLYQLEYDIKMLHKELDQKSDWIQRLQSDPTAWEQVAREKMNYLVADEVLVTFVPKKVEP